MRQLVQYFRSGELKIEEVPAPSIKQGGVLVQNHFSLISAGTERMLVELGQKSILGKAKERPDLVKQVREKVKRDGLVSTLRRVANRMDSPMPLGYSSSGTIIAVGDGIERHKAGSRVACAGGGYANHAEVVFVPKNLCVSIPESVDLEDAAFTTLGAIALQGIRRAEPQIGECVVVIGLGLVGQITVQILKANGCQILGVDIDPERAELAQKLGADNAVSPEDAQKACSDLSDGIGADSVIVTASTTSNEPVEMAGEIARDRGKIAVVGAVGMDVPRNLYYRKELDLRLSRSYGPGRYDADYEEKGIDYPASYVRWTEKRNMEAFLGLVAAGKVKPRELITHTFGFDDALKAYDIITKKSQEKHLAILLKYNVKNALKDNISASQVSISASSHASHTDQINIGVIGAGNFARDVLLPELSKIEAARIKSIATATGLTAAHAGKKFGCDYVTSDYKEIINDNEINAVIIATRHNLHSQIAIDALNSGKYVFVEKPLALSMEQLEQVVYTFRESSGNIMVGFNRRFAPLAQKIEQYFHDRIYPLSINYRINAGRVPADSWVQDSEEGGGRIIGEVCHFVDFLQYMAHCDPIRVYADMLRGSGQDDGPVENVSVTIGYQDGSIGTINYLANGDSRTPKERIEIFGGGSVGIIDDFRRAEISGENIHKKFSGRQDKGHSSELREFVKAVKNADKMPIEFRESIAATMVTFKILQSIKSGLPETVIIDL